MRTAMRGRRPGSGARCWKHTQHRMRAARSAQRHRHRSRPTVDTGPQYRLDQGCGAARQAGRHQSDGGRPPGLPDALPAHCIRRAWPPGIVSDQKERTPGKPAFFAQRSMAAVGRSKRRHVRRADQAPAPHREWLTECRKPASTGCGRRARDRKCASGTSRLRAPSAPGWRLRTDLSAAPSHACRRAFSPARVRPAVVAGSGFAAAPAPATGGRRCRPRVGCSVPAACSWRSWCRR